MNIVHEKTFVEVRYVVIIQRAADVGFPAKPVVELQFAADPPAVLGIEADVFVALGIDRQAGGAEARCLAQKEVGQRNTGDLAGKTEAAARGAGKVAFWAS